MADSSLVTNGILTAGRLATIQACLAAIEEHVTFEHEILVIDNTPGQNQGVKYDQ